MSGNLERRYRRVLRLLPGYYREQWEQDMVAAFLDSWLTGDPEADEYITKAAGPSWSEVASVAGLAARLYLGGAGAPRRYFAWGQGIRNAVLAVLLVRAVRGLAALVFLAWAHRLGGVPAPPVSMETASPGGIWPAVGLVADGAWIVIFVALVLGHYRTAQVIAALAIAPGLAALAQTQFPGGLPQLVGPWAYWLLLGLVPVLAMAAFHRDAPPVARRPWLVALPALYLLVAVPELTTQAAGHSAWLPDFPGLCCILVAVACLAHAPRAQSGVADSGVWSLTLILLAAVAGVYRIASLGDDLHDPPLMNAGLAEILALVVAVGLVARDAANARTAISAPPPYPHLG